MSSPLRTPLSAALLIGGAVVGLAGVLLWLVEGAPSAPALAMAGGGLASVLTGAWAHDHGHRRRGEHTHAVWGADDRTGPAWLRRRGNGGGRSE